MNQEQIFDKVRQVIGNRLCRDWRSLTAETHLKSDLLCDSLDLAEILMDLEDAFTLRHHSAYDELPATIGGIVSFIQTSLGTLARPPVVTLTEKNIEWAAEAKYCRMANPDCDPPWSHADESIKARMRAAARETAQDLFHGTGMRLEIVP